MKTIFFVRHGETEANVAGIVSGAENDTPLTKKGQQQAKQIGEDLRDKNIQLIVASPLDRAVKTAKIIAEQINYDVDKIVTHELFVEAKMGPYSGRPREEWITARDSGKLEDGVEGHEEHFNRVKESLEYLTQFPEERILIVSHGATSRMVQLIIRGLTHKDFRLVDRIGNAELLEFEL